MEALGLIVLSTLTIVAAVLGYSLQKLLKRCLQEMKAANATLDGMRVQLGTPQQAVYRLVAMRGVPEPSETPGRIPDRPNPA